MTTRIVNRYKERYDIYIGRDHKDPKGRGKWGNPFVVGMHGTQEECVKLHREWIMTQPELLKQIPELKGKVLGCHCKPKPCHGDTLAELADNNGQLTN